MLWSIIGLVVAVAVAVVIAVSLPSGGRRSVTNEPRRPQAPTLVAWVDANERLHIGNLANSTQRVVGIVNGDPTVPLLSDAGDVYVVDTGGQYVPEIGTWSEVVRVYNVTSNTLTFFGPGQGIFPSADRQHLFLAQMDGAHLLELPTSGTGAPASLALPSGWFVTGGHGLGVGDEIVLQSNSDANSSAPSTIGLWSVGTKRVRSVGKVSAEPRPWVIGAFTGKGRHFGTLAWIPFRCSGRPGCPIELTDTASLRSRAVHPPPGHAFVDGGAFSPDGRRLAAFVYGPPKHGETEAALAIVDLASGRLRLVPRDHFPLGENIAWAVWLSEDELLAEGPSDNFIVDTRTLVARPAAFLRTGGSEQADLSTVVLSGR